VHLQQQGASFWNQLRAAAPGASDRELLAALWDLVWAGEVTNDSLAPLRAVLSGGRGAGRSGGGTAGPGRSPRGRPRPGRLSTIGPPAGAGRWSLVTPLLEPRPGPTELAHATALQLLERHGVLTREAVLAEGVPGGFTGVYGVLKVLEERGQVRRGYFVTGLGAAQFALPGAVDRLRSNRGDVSGEDPGQDHEPPLVLAATDPAQPYGAALPWPRRDDKAKRPQRAAGAHVVLAGSEPVLHVERGGRGILILTEPDDPRVRPSLEALAAFITADRRRKLSLERIDGEPVVGSAWEPLLIELGFRQGPRKLTLSA
jgi:ATP-dependent Lhr-like helicase